jgi:AcrR family transcriptional regulator
MNATLGGGKHLASARNEPAKYTGRYTGEREPPGMQAPLKRSELKGHIARAAADLFYRYGIHAVGVDRIADEAGVTKRTLYHHYPSKDELIAAALRVSPIVEFPREGTPVDRIMGAFIALKEFLARTDYRGCPYIFFTAELVDRNHPARHMVQRRVAKRRAWFTELAGAAGAHDPTALAEQLDVLFDGALASGTKREDLRPVEAAIGAARSLIELACVTSARRSEPIPA